MDRPVAVFVPTMLLLVVLGLPFLGVRLNAPDASILPPEVPSRAAYDVLVEEFGEGDLGPLFLADSDGRARDRPRERRAALRLVPHLGG